MNTHYAASVFRVTNVDAALKYYTDVLGFSEDFRFGDYAGIKLGSVLVHLSGHSVHQRPIGGGTVYVFCDEVDSYYTEIKTKGARIVTEPKDYDYGMRDFVIQDPDGNHISFGCALKHRQQDEN